MVKSIKCKKSRTLFEAGWKHSLQEILKQRQKNIYLQESRVILPFGYHKAEANDTPFFFKIEMDIDKYSDTLDELFGTDFTGYGDLDEKDSQNFKDTIFEHSNNTIPMVGFVKNMSRDRTMMGIRQTFVGTINEITKIDFNAGFQYKWDKRKKLVSITYYLGSTAPKVVEKSAIKLLRECQAFFTIYTEEGKNLLNNMV